MRLLVFHNLSSGTIDGSSYDFIRSFAEADDEVVIRYADCNSDFDALLEGAASFDAVVACGGDGTVATVLFALRNTGVPVLPFPAGTANLLTLNLSSPTESPALAKLLREGKRMDFDMCEIECGGQKYGFVLTAGCGYDATIMNAALEKKKSLGQLAYFQAAFANPNPQFSKLKIWVDEEYIETEGVGVLLINFSKIQGDISLATPSCTPCDGMFDILVLATHTALNLLPTFLAISLDKSGKPLENNDVLAYYRGSEVRIEADPPLRVQYDGEPLEATTPLTARILPGAARIIVSDATYEQFNS